MINVKFGLGLEDEVRIPLSSMDRLLLDCQRELEKYSYASHSLSKDYEGINKWNILHQETENRVAPPTVTPNPALDIMPSPTMESGWESDRILGVNWKDLNLDNILNGVWEDAFNILISTLEGAVTGGPFGGLVAAGASTILASYDEFQGIWGNRGEGTQYTIPEEMMAPAYTAYQDLLSRYETDPGGILSYIEEVSEYVNLGNDATASMYGALLASPEIKYQDAINGAMDAHSLATMDLNRQIMAEQDLEERARLYEAEVPLWITMLDDITIAEQERENERNAIMESMRLQYSSELQEVLDAVTERLDLRGDIAGYSAWEGTLEEFERQNRGSLYDDLLDDILRLGRGNYVQYDPWLIGNLKTLPEKHGFENGLRTEELYQDIEADIGRRLWPLVEEEVISIPSLTDYLRDNVEEGVFSDTIIHALEMENAEYLELWQGLYDELQARNPPPDPLDYGFGAGPGAGFGWPGVPFIGVGAPPLGVEEGGVGYEAGYGVGWDYYEGIESGLGEAMQAALEAASFYEEFYNMGNGILENLFLGISENMYYIPSGVFAMDAAATAALTSSGPEGHWSP